MIFRLVESVPKISKDLLDKWDKASPKEKDNYLDAILNAYKNPALFNIRPSISRNFSYFGIDPENNPFMKLLDGLKKKYGKTVLAVMHDLGQAVRWADNVAVISEKRIFFYGSVEKCLEERVLENVFGVKRHEADGEIFFSAD